MSGERAPAQTGEVPSRGEKPSRRRLIRTLQAVLVAAIVYFLGAYLLRSWVGIQAYEWTLRPAWLLLSASAFLLFYAAQALAWWLLLRGFELNSPFTLATATWAKSILARYLPGTVFMFVGRAWMCHAQGLPVDRVSAAMVYEQALGVCSALVTLAILLPFWEHQTGLTTFALVLIPVIVALLHPKVFAPAAGWLLEVLRRPPLDVVLPFGRVLGLLAFFTGAWAFSGLGAWALGRAVAGLHAEALPGVVAAYALAYVAGMAAFIVPSGLGVREAVLTASLVRHLPSGVALAWALFLRLWVTVLELAFVGLAVVVETLAKRRRR